MGGGSSKSGSVNKAPTDPNAKASAAGTDKKDASRKTDTSPAKTKPSSQDKRSAAPFSGTPHEQSVEMQKEAFLDGCADELQIDRVVIAELHKHYEVLCKRAGASGHYTGKISVNNLFESGGQDPKKAAMERLIFEFMASTTSLEEKKVDSSSTEGNTSQQGASGSSEKRIDFKSFSRFMSVFVTDSDNLDSKLTAIFLVLCQAGNGDRKDIMTSDHLKALKDSLKITSAQTTFPGRDTWNCQRFIQETKIEFQKEPEMFQVNMFKKETKAHGTKKKPTKSGLDSGAGLGPKLHN